MMTYDKKVAHQNCVTTADDGMLTLSTFAKVKAARDITCSERVVSVCKARFHPLPLETQCKRAQGQLEGVKMRNRTGIKCAFPLL